MCSLARRAPSLKCLVAFFVLATALPGCSRQKSDKEAVDQFFKDNPKAKREEIAKFSGRVTIDGLPPTKIPGAQLFILLNDPQHLQKLPTRFTPCAEDGSFEFMTYMAGDGVPVGKYVVEFVQLHLPRGGRQRSGGSGVTRNYVGPDGLKNLYCDPEKNVQDEKLQVDVQPPGRTDYEFNLSVAGKDPVTNPGKFAATMVPTL